jgi:hypothetical protein
MSPNHNAALAISSSVLGPAGITRFSMRRCALPSVHAEARAVPPVDGAVVQAQRLELGELAAVQHLERLLVELGADERAEARDVLAEDLDDRLLDPARAEAHAGLGLAHVVLALRSSTACRNSAMRVSAHRRLPNTIGELVATAMIGPARSWASCSSARSRGPDLQVDLEARVAGLQHDRVVIDVELVEALDRAARSCPPRMSVTTLFSCQVARARHHAVEAQVGLAQGGQDAHEHDVHVRDRARLAGPVDEIVELAVHLGEAIPVSSCGSQLASSWNCRARWCSGGRGRAAFEHLHHAARRAHRPGR